MEVFLVIVRDDNKPSEIYGPFWEYKHAAIKARELIAEDSFVFITITNTAAEAVTKTKG